MNCRKIFCVIILVTISFSAITLFAYDPKAVALYDQANKNLEKKKIKEAIRLFKKSLKIDKTLFEAYYLLGNIYYVQGKNISSKANYIKAITLNPKHTKAHRFLGNLYLNSGNIEKAAEHLEQAFSLDPKSRDILSEYATAIYYMGDTRKTKAVLKKNYSKNHFGINYLLYKVFSSEDKVKEATKHLEYAHKVSPTEKTTNELSHNYISLKRYDAALSILLKMEDRQDLHYEQIITIFLLQNRIEDSKNLLKKNAAHISHDTFFKLKGDILLLDKDYDKALKAYKKIRKKNIFFELNEKFGNIYFKKNDYKNARYYYKRVLKNTSANISIEKRIAFIFYAENKLDKAFNMANRILQKLPNDTEILNQIALVLLKQKKLPLSKHYFTRSISIYNEQAVAHYYLGIINYKMKLYDLSIVNFDTSLKYDPNSTSAYIYMGNAYEIVNQYDQAFTHFKKALEIEKDNTTALLNIGKAYYNQNEIAESLKYLLRYLELVPKDSETTFLVSQIYSSKKDNKSAKQYINKAISIKGFSPEYLLKLATIHVNTKNTTKAISTLQNLLKREPANINANMKLGDIHLSLNKKNTALHFYRAVIMVESSNIKARAHLVKIYLSLNLLVKANYHIKKLKYYKPTAPIVSWAEGVIEYKGGNITKALDHFSKSTYDPTSTNIFQGKIYFTLKEYEKSLFHFNKTIEQNPNNLISLSYLALINFEKNDFDQALDILNKIIKENKEVFPELLYATAEIEYKKKDSPRALSLANLALEKKTTLNATPFSKSYKNKLYLLLGTLYSDINENLKATQYLTKVKGKTYKVNYVNINLLLALNYFKSFKRKEALLKWNLVLQKAPENPDALLGISRLFSLQRNYNKAISFAKKVISLPTDGQKKEAATLMIGDIYLKKSKPKKAIEAFESAVKLNPDNISSYIKLADTKFLTKDYGGTVTTLQEAIKLDKKNTALRFLLGRSFTNLGDLANAADQFEEVIAIDPQNLTAYVSLVDVLVKSQKLKTAKQYINHALKIIGNDANSRNIAKKLNSIKKSISKDNI